MRVRCTKTKTGAVRHDLTLGAEYEVIGIECDDYRLIGDSGAPFVYPRRAFRVVDPARPPDWATRVSNGREYAYAPGIGAPGFFEDYFDEVPAARRAFNRYLNLHLRLTRAA